MLPYLRRVDAPELQAWFRSQWHLHGRFRVAVVQSEGVMWDDRVILGTRPRHDAVHRRAVMITLAGDVVARDGARVHELAPGGVLFFGRKAAMDMHHERGRTARLYVEWDDGSLGSGGPEGLSSFALDATSLARLRVAGATLAADGAEPRATTAAARDVLAVLRASGVPFDRWSPGDLLEPSDVSMELIARALSHSVGNLRAQPMMTDLVATTGNSERTALRGIQRFNARYGFNARTWRETIFRWRVSMGTMLMTARGATTERVAALVGFGSSSAFCHALAHAAVPAPSEIPRAFALAL